LLKGNKHWHGRKGREKVKRSERCNIVKISLKRVEMNFCLGSKNSMQGKNRKIWQNYQRIMSLLQSFIDKNRCFQQMKPKKNSLLLSWICKKKHVLDNYHKFQTTISSSQLKGILKQSKNTLHTHIIPNIVKISLKRVEMNFCLGSTNSIQGKDRKIWQNYQRIMSLFYGLRTIEWQHKHGQYHRKVNEYSPS
jgi:iron-sulfur cluster repair protein YtfE (RIC family)